MLSDGLWTQRSARPTSSVSTNVQQRRRHSDVYICYPPSDVVRCEFYLLAASDAYPLAKNSLLSIGDAATSPT